MRKIILAILFLFVITLSQSQNCVIDPSPPACENYVLPGSNVTNSIKMLCSMMPNMPGCSVSRQCASGYGSGTYCEPFSHLKEICTEMGGMRGCENYNSMCLPNNTRVNECRTPVLPLPTQLILWNLTSSICHEMFMPDCSRCTSYSNCDVFVVYSSLCTSMPMMKQCNTVWHQICGLIPDWVACGGTPVLDCLNYPWLSGCENYILPKSNVTSDINMLCSEDHGMPYMPGCTISNECTNGRGSGAYCEPFSHLKEICTDMGGMMGCENYNSLCLPNNTKVQECDTQILNLPTQTYLWNQISGMCKEMYMSDCDRCPHNGQCDVLTVYSALCFSMPGMPQCGTWHQICGKIPNWVICAGEPDRLQPIMRMYFHTDLTDYILFYQWVPRDQVTYILSVLAVIAIAFLHEGLRTIKFIMEYKLRKEETKKFQEITPLNYLSETKYPPFHWKDFFHALIRTLDTTLHFLIMLITMTFNVGLFVGVMGGYYLGYLVFGRFLRPIGSLGAPLEGQVCH